MTNSKGIDADYNDVLIEGETLGSDRITLFDGTATGYSIEIVNADYTDRTMTIKVTK